MIKKLHNLVVVFLLIAGSAFGSRSALDPSLVGWYRGEGNAEDSSTSDNDATFGGSYVAGKFGKAFGAGTVSVPGSIGGPINFGVDDDFTWSVWVKKDETRSHMKTIMGFDRYYRLAWHISNGWRMYIGVNDDILATQSATGIDVVDNWHHLAVTYTGGTRSFSLYLDGVKKKTGTAPDVDFWDPDNLSVGGSNQSVDEILIFNRTLSAVEIARLYTASASDLEATFSDWADSLITIGGNSYYVATDGSDDDAGGIDDPFLTIQKFADIAIAGDTCYIRGGTYRETVTPAHSGNTDSVITYRPYPGETVVVSGADILDVSWSVHSGSIYSGTSATDLGLGFNQVFVDGDAMTWARSPNTANYSGKVDDYAQHEAEVFEVTSGSSSRSSTRATVGSTDLTEPAAYWDGALINVIYSPRYYAVTGTVDTYTVGVLNVTLDLKAHGGSITKWGRFYLTDMLEALDTAGEWFLNEDTTTMYLWTPDSTDPGDSLIEVKARQTAFDLDDISYTIIDGLSIFAANIETNRYSTYNTFKELDIDYVSHYTVIDTGLVTTGSHGVRDTGIILDGNNNTLQSSTINLSAGNGVALIGDNCSVLSSTISNVNYNATGCAGVHLGHGNGHEARYDNTISYCTISDSGRDSINLSGSSNITVTYNDLSGTRSTGWTWDLGVITTGASNGGGTTIAYNRIYDCRSYGIYLDNNSSYFNVCYNIVNGLSWTSGTEHSIQLNQPTKYCNINNNTLYNGHIRTNRIGSNELSMEGTVIDNNIVGALSTVGAAKFTGYPDPTDDAILTRNRKGGSK